MRSAVLLALVFALALLPPDASACRPTSSSPQVNTCVVTTAQPCLYVIVDTCAGCISAWVYQENNHIPGLQRHDSTADDTCGGVIDGDLIIT